jgi:Predicted aminopeptidases
MPQTSPTALAAQVDGAALMETVRSLAKWVKLSGTPEERESFDYVQSVLDKMGWRTEMIVHEAYISLPGKARVEVDGNTLDCITHSHSAQSPATGTTGELVYLGNGTAEDFKGKDLAGKILVIEGIAKPPQAWLSLQAGAAGQIHITPGDMLHEMCISPVWGSPSAETIDLMPSTVIVTVSGADGEMLKQRIKAGQTGGVTLFAEVDTKWTETPLLVAELDAPNAAPDASFVMFSGHIDTWYYGVMDNGTANATIIEVARLAQAHRQEWKRGLRLCFWSGHSHGRYSGSAWYADAKWRELDKRCVAHVNVDSTGGKGANVLTNSGSNAELRAIATDAIKAEAGQDYAGKRLGRQGDESFWGVGIPAMFGSLSHHAPSPGEKAHMHLGWWWHTAEDTLDKIDEANLVRDTKVFAHVIWRLLTDPLVPLDYTIHADDLLAELDKLGNAIDLSEVRDGAIRLCKNMKALKIKAADANEAGLAAMNTAILKVSRALVPMDSTKGDRFVHDPALPQPGWPVLQPVRALSGHSKGSDAWRFQKVSAVRAVNRMVHALDAANEALELHL